MATVAPFGSWRSPITSELIVSGTIGLGEVALDGNDLYWIERRPGEGGRCVIVKRSASGNTADINPSPFNARTRVHEYGGGSYFVKAGRVYFSHFGDQRLYTITGSGTPQAITPEQAYFYAEGIIDEGRNRIICVREDHTIGDREAINTIVAIDLNSVNEGTVLVSGYDFYASARLSPDGDKLAWLCWRHPNMPWDGTELWVGTLNGDGSIGHSEKIAGGETESIFQPEWSPDGRLYFLSDRSGWWNFYRWDGADTEAILPMAAEFGLPQWGFGMSTYAFDSAARIVCTYTEEGKRRLALLDTKTLKLDQIETNYTEISYLRAGNGQTVFCAGSPVEPTSIVKIDLATGKREVLRRSSSIELDNGYLSVPEPIEFPTEGGLTAYAYYYAPKNRDYRAPDDERPPLLVKSHGGPTASTSTALNLGIQYWTSRGFAVLDVNYGGSSGYGRAYRERLNGKWGIVDVDDCCNGARFLVESGRADACRLAIDGGSAGGYTTLCALVFRDVFSAGASHYGVSDLEALAKDTHKFESRYLDRLIGRYPEERAIYVARSPIHAVDRLNCPVILFQGLEDKVVPPEQAEMMVAALKAKGLPVAYVPFEGEQHGFRKAENIRRALDGEFYFYARIFRFQPAEQIEPVTIENL